MLSLGMVTLKMLENAAVQLSFDLILDTKVYKILAK